MRYSRIFLRAQGNHFHVVSRIAGREFLLGENEKRVFHRIMRRIARVAGVEVLTHCLMDNHVHLLLRTEVLEEPEAIVREQRKKLAGRIKDMSEQARVALRNLRRDQNKAVDDASLPEDDQKSAKEEIQKILKSSEGEVDSIVDTKTKEIMEI